MTSKETNRKANPDFNWFPQWTKCIVLRNQSSSRGEHCNERNRFTVNKFTYQLLRHLMVCMVEQEQLVWRLLCAEIAYLFQLEIESIPWDCCQCHLQKKFHHINDTHWLFQWICFEQFLTWSVQKNHSSRVGLPGWGDGFHE